MNMRSDLTEQQLKSICSHIILTNPQTICDNQWCFMQYRAPMPLVYQSFILEFTKPYIDNFHYRQGIHTVCSEIYQAAVN